MKPVPDQARPIDRLLALMADLRDPDGGCPWDLAQDFASVAPYTIEEAYEVAEAIDRGDLDDLRGELGDLLLQVVFHAQMAREAGLFDFEDVATAITEKMVRRHPHVYGSSQADDPAGVLANWDAIKRAERDARGERDGSALAGISAGLPEWLKAAKLQARAARSGFDWPSPAPVMDKLAEELEEVRAEFARGPVVDNQQALEEEIGDLLFVAANLARHAGVDPGTALRRANLKFERRFRAMEALASQRGQVFAELDLAAQEALWQQVKSGG